MSEEFQLDAADMAFINESVGTGNVEGALAYIALRRRSFESASALRNAVLADIATEAAAGFPTVRARHAELSASDDPGDQQVADRMAIALGAT